MKISKKKRCEISEAINDAYIEVLNEFFPDDEMEVPPDMWDDETKRKFDMLAILEANVQRKVKAVLDS